MTVAVAALASVLGMLALLAVFTFWGAGNSSAALPYFAVPGVLFALAGFLGYRALKPQGWLGSRGGDRSSPAVVRRSRRRL
jgi:hypothetical protein